jgi:hypothetical protein
MEAVIATAHRARIAAALALDDTLDQRHRHAVGAGLRRRHAVERRGLIPVALTEAALAPIVLAPIAQAPIVLPQIGFARRERGRIGIRRVGIKPGSEIVRPRRQHVLPREAIVMTRRMLPRQSRLGQYRHHQHDKQDREKRTTHHKTP